MASQLLDDAEHGRWWRTAASAEEMATVARDHDHHHHACLHAGQAAQLGLKALLHGVGATSQAHGHDLSGLGRRAADTLGAPFAGDVHEALARLARHYLPTRYPDALPGGAPPDEFTAADSAQATADARLVLESVATAWAALRDAARMPGADPDGP